MTAIRCAIYTRKSSEEGLEQAFNSLDAQREACEAYILSQRHEGWQVVHTKYDDGGFSGGNMERPALKRLLDDIAAKRIDNVVVYKVDRLTRSLADFAKIVEQFDKQGISFVSVTQQFNTTTSMGRLTLNVLLSFAQFEREVTGERIRDKIAASKKKGMWMGGTVPLGYDLQDRVLIANPAEAAVVNNIYQAYLKLGCVMKLRAYLEQRGIRSKRRVSKAGNVTGGNVFSRGALYEMLQNRIYLGEIKHKQNSYPGQHLAIIDRKLWDQVQAQLKTNLQAPQRRPRATEQSLLVGLIYDKDGNRFTPTHANKKGRRYRYYTSQAIIEKPGKGSDGPIRFPAREIEELVISQFTQLLQSPQRMNDLLSDPDNSPADMKHMTEAIREWGTASTDKIQNLLKTAVKRIIMQDKKVELQISQQAVRQAVLGTDDHPETPNEQLFVMESSAQLKRCGREVRLVLPPDTPGTKPHPTPALIHAIARAHDWVERILNGDATNQRAIAAETGLDERYVSRLLPLAFLAPDLTEAILEGKQPAHLSLETCLGNIPANWQQQREQLEK